ncbi:MAG: RloB domain-containing protein [Lachnospiraceae bacterium]|nr:RloB domain-containing protein [Lachnospiraceae bacterium]
MSLPYRLGSSSLFVRTHEDSVEPKRVVFLSTEGTKTEVHYFNFIEKYRERLEFWQLLHVSDVASEYSESLEDILRNKPDEKRNSFVSNLLYEKTGQRKAIQAKTFEKFYLPNVDLAIERAKGFASSDQLLEKIGSNLWELIELLREK